MLPFVSLYLKWYFMWRLCSLFNCRIIQVYLGDRNLNFTEQRSWKEGTWSPELDPFQFTDKDFLKCVIWPIPVWLIGTCFSAFWSSWAPVKEYFYKMLISPSWFVYYTCVAACGAQETVWILGAQSCEALAHFSRTQSPKPCCKMEVLISNYLYKPWRSLFVGVTTPC